MRILLLNTFFIFLSSFCLIAQTPLNIPPVLTGTTFNLNVQSGSRSFYPSTTTPTYGINGGWMAPTIIVNKGDSITLNVKNNLTVKTTMHWHGLHVAPQNDGGPHQMINTGTTWSPSFKIRNNAGTYWYHPHGAGQTDPQVSKGLAGFFIVHDPAELALNIPHTYGVDDIPIVVQTKNFDALQQIAIATDMDTAIFINGTLNPYFDAPAQVLRFRLLNGSSLRSYNFGLSNGQSFYQIATDGGVLDRSIALTTLRLSPGERAEILIDFSGMNGQSIYLKSFASKLPKGIYGADSVGLGIDTIPDYHDNFLNGADFNLLKINITPPNTSPIHTIPTTLIPFTAYTISSATRYRTFVLDTFRALPTSTPNRAEGPFGINYKTFYMDSVNEVVYLNTTEVWTLINRSLVAHPFHIHDVQFDIIEKSGLPPSPSESGWKDVVLVMPNDSVKVITKFEDFANNKVPYMYHCHLLHHEDDGMMGSFLVIDSTTMGVNNFITTAYFNIYPNPSTNTWIVQTNHKTSILQYTLKNMMGQIMMQGISSNNLPLNINNTSLSIGEYILTLQADDGQQSFKLIKQ